MKQAWILLCLGMVLLSGRALAQPAGINFAPMVDWKNPMGLTLEKVQRYYTAQPALRNNNWLQIRRDKIAYSSLGVYVTAQLTEDENTLLMRFGSSTVPVEKFYARFVGIKLHYVSFKFAGESLTEPDFCEKFIQDVQSLSAWEAPVFSTIVRIIPQADLVKRQTVLTDLTEEQWLWQRDGWFARLSRSHLPEKPWSNWSFSFGDNRSLLMPKTTPTPAPGEEPPMIVEEVTEKPAFTEIKADLDSLLNFGAIWATTTDQFEKIYLPRTEEKQEQPPQFEWLTTTKDRARFSRQMFTDVPSTLTLFGGAVKVEEAVVEFVNGKAGRAAISIYNRGDAGQMGSSEFQALFKKVGQSLGEVLKVAPKRQTFAGTGSVKNVAWMWTSPLGVALLEHNDYQNQAALGQPEYLRLKLAAPSQADWTMGRMTMGVQRMTLQKNVTKDAATGDIYISGVPMVDQGAKGYCVAASCQRLFEYMRIPCDQHEMAQLLNVDVESGANVAVMQKSLAKVDQKFGVAFKPLVNPEQYFSGDKRRVSQKQFDLLVREHVDKGMPLLWGLELGRYPEDPPLPNGGQVSGGHMRMIIGYNTVKNQIIFTDSWGAGHERKRMDATYAYKVTLGLYSMAPRGM